MTAQLPLTTEINPMVVQFHPIVPLTDDQFYDFCQLNKNFRIERNRSKEVIFMSPTGSETDQRNFNLIVQLGIWTEQDNTGVGFGSSGGFTLPNGAVRSPDAAWIKKTRWDAIPQEQRQKFAPICPEFVIELRSDSDALKALKSKMEEYIENGTLLGWLIDRVNRTVYIYRPNTVVEELDNPITLSGEDILPGFVLDLNPVW